MDAIKEFFTFSHCAVGLFINFLELSFTSCPHHSAHQGSTRAFWGSFLISFDAFFSDINKTARYKVKV